jgi:ATP-binding cassette, subfamily C (CFTR/MRP), member 4
MDHKHNRRKVINPYNEANRLSKMSFWWLRSLYKIGLTRTITEDDIYETLKDHESEKIATKFTRLWSDELKKKNPSVLRMFYRAYGFWALLIGLMFSITETLIRCAQPLFLGALLTYFVDPETSKRDAYFYASGIVICSFTSMATYHAYNLYISELGAKLKIGSSKLLYDKVIPLLGRFGTFHLTCEISDSFCECRDLLKSMTLRAESSTCYRMI